MTHNTIIFLFLFFAGWVKNEKELKANWGCPLAID
jgi:hypothetical protein